MPKIKNMGSATMRFNEGIIVSGSAANNEALIVTGSAVILGNLSDYVVVVDNDQGSSGHGLKVTTDGTGTGTTILDLEAGSSTVFKVRGDGRVGIGVSTPGSTLSVDDEIAVGEKLIHRGDPDTYLMFDDDELHLAAGGRTFLKLEESATDKLIVNHGALDIDFQVKGENAANLIRTDAENDSIYFGASSGAGVDNNFWVSGSIGSQGSSTRGTAVFGGDVVTSGSLRVSDAFTLPSSDGNNKQVLTTNGVGTVTWSDQQSAPSTNVIMVHMSSDFDFNTSTANEFQNVPFNSVFQNTFGPSDFNTSNYTFTAPEEGYYYINVSVFQQTLNTDTTQYQLRISSSCDYAESNGAIAFRNYFPGAAAEATMHMHRLDRVAHLSGSDEIKITFRNIRADAESGSVLRHEKHLSYLTINKL